MTKKRIAILICLVIFGAAAGYFYSGYVNDLALTGSAATDHVTANMDIIRPLPVTSWVNWTMAGVNIAIMAALIVAGVMIGRKYESR